AFLNSLPGGKRSVAERADAWLKEAAAIAAQPRTDPKERSFAIRLLAHAPWATAGPVLANLLAEDAQEGRLAAVRSLSAQPDPEVGRLLMKSWAGYTPALRREVLEAMLRQPDRTALLLDEVEMGRVRPGDIDALRTRQLVNHGKADVRDRARK